MTGTLLINGICPSSRQQLLQNKVLYFRLLVRFFRGAVLTDDAGFLLSLDLLSLSSASTVSSLATNSASFLCSTFLSLFPSIFPHVSFCFQIMRFCFDIVMIKRIRIRASKPKAESPTAFNESLSHPAQMNSRIDCSPRI